MQPAPVVSGLWPEAASEWQAGLPDEPNGRDGAASTGVARYACPTARCPGRSFAPVPGRISPLLGFRQSEE